MKHVFILLILFVYSVTLRADFDAFDLIHADGYYPPEITDHLGTLVSTVGDLKVIRLNPQGDTGIFIPTIYGGTGGEIFYIYTYADSMWHGTPFFGFPYYTDSLANGCYQLILSYRGGAGFNARTLYAFKDTCYEKVWDAGYNHEKMINSRNLNENYPLNAFSAIAARIQRALLYTFVYGDDRYVPDSFYGVGNLEHLYADTEARYEVELYAKDAPPDAVPIPGTKFAIRYTFTPETCDTYRESVVSTTQRNLLRRTDDYESIVRRYIKSTQTKGNYHKYVMFRDDFLPDSPIQTLMYDYNIAVTFSNAPLPAQPDTAVVVKFAGQEIYASFIKTWHAEPIADSAIRLLAAHTQHDFTTDSYPMIQSIEEPYPQYTPPLIPKDRPLPEDGYLLPELVKPAICFTNDTHYIIERDLNNDGVPELILSRGNDFKEDIQIYQYTDSGWRHLGDIGYHSYVGEDDHGWTQFIHVREMCERRENTVYAFRDTCYQIIREEIHDYATHRVTPYTATAYDFNGFSAIASRLEQRVRSRFDADFQDSIRTRYIPNAVFAITAPGYGSVTLHKERPDEPARKVKGTEFYVVENYTGKGRFTDLFHRPLTRSQNDFDAVAERVRQGFHDTLSVKNYDSPLFGKNEYHLKFGYHDALTLSLSAAPFPDSARFVYKARLKHTSFYIGVNFDEKKVLGRFRDAKPATVAEFHATLKHLLTRDFTVRDEPKP